MTVDYGSSTVLAEATRTNSTYVAPAGITGDGAAGSDLLLIAHLEFLSGSFAPTPTPPAGFATLPGITWPLAANSGNYGVWVWYKVANAESGNYTVTHASAVSRGMAIRVTGADTTTPFLPNPTANQGTSGTSTFLGLTTLVDLCLILAIGIDNNDLGANLTPPTGTTPTFTEQIDDNHGNYLATGIMSPAGATGNKTMTNNSGAGAPWFAVLVAVQPAPPQSAYPYSNLDAKMEASI